MTFADIIQLIDEIVPDANYNAGQMNFLLRQMLQYAQAQGGSGGGGGSLTLRTNGLANVSQALLDLRDGNDIEIVDNGDGTVTINYTGEGGGGSFPGGMQGNMLQHGVSDWEVVMAITDSFGVMSVDYDNRVLYDAMGDVALDWSNGLPFIPISGTLELVPDFGMASVFVDTLSALNLTILSAGLSYGNIETALFNTVFVDEFSVTMGAPSIAQFLTEWKIFQNNFDYMINEPVGQLSFGAGHPLSASDTNVYLGTTDSGLGGYLLGRPDDWIRIEYNEIMGYVPFYAYGM
jgi:hypothetical protein